MKESALADSLRGERAAHELLVVDDDPASRYATARLLRAAGFRIREAATGAEGLLYADGRISAMILDVHLPDIDGFELCRLLRSRPDTARLPVLHLTAAYVTDEDKVRGLDAGADAYLTHPVEPAVLVATVQAVVRTYAAEQAMRRSEAKFRAAYTHAPSGICLLDDNGKIVDANPALLAILRYGADTVLGRPVADFVPPEWASRVSERATKYRTTTVRDEFPLCAADGATIQVEWTWCPHIEPHLSMGVATDISARANLERQRQELFEREQVARATAERMSRMKDDLIAVLSHELRTPLNAILGWTHTLRRRAETPQLLQGLEVIRRNAQSQAQLISDILDMSRMSVGKLHLDRQVLDPTEFVISAAETARPIFEAKEQKLALDVTPMSCRIEGDSLRLQQVVGNLLSNAAKFSPRGAEIRLSLKEEEHGIRVLVADNGRGIAPEAMPFIFDRFAQSDPTSNRLLGGLGLGLSIVKQLVEAHGGTVTAYSEGVGRGSVFELSLPSAAARHTAGRNAVDARAPEEPLNNDQTIANLRLLVVEDDADARAVLELILGDRGAIVRSATNYDEALSMIPDFEPDALISDIGMPGKDGLALIREIRRREASSGHHLPAIALTAFTRAQDQRQALSEGFDAHSSKPVQPDRLVRQIGGLVRQRATWHGIAPLPSDSA